MLQNASPQSGALRSPTCKAQRQLLEKEIYSLSFSKLIVLLHTSFSDASGYSSAPL